MLFTHIPNTQLQRFLAARLIDGSTDRWINRPNDHQPSKSKNQPKQQKKRNEPKQKSLSHFVSSFVVFVFNYLQKSWLREYSIVICVSRMLRLRLRLRRVPLLPLFHSFHCVPKALLACACVLDIDGQIDSRSRARTALVLAENAWVDCASVYLRAKYTYVWKCVCFF